MNWVENLNCILVPDMGWMDMLGEVFCENGV